MRDTYLNSNQLFKSTIRVPKEHSVFLYFIIEAMEGLCFYSTLDFERGQTYREIEFSGAIESKAEFLDITNRLKKLIPEMVILNS